MYVVALADCLISLRLDQFNCRQESPDRFGLDRSTIVNIQISVQQRFRKMKCLVNTHPAMFSHPNPRRVLVIGGGDGYVLSEVLKHPEVEHVDHVDLDGAVVQVCKAHFVWGNAWDDPRVSLHIADGAEFIKNATAGSYDVIIQDSSDPFTWDEESGEKIELPSKSLYTDEHFENISRALGDKGVFAFQAEVSTIWCW